MHWRTAETLHEAEAIADMMATNRTWLKESAALHVVACFGGTARVQLVSDCTLHFQAVAKGEQTVARVACLAVVVQCDRGAKVKREGSFRIVALAKLEVWDSKLGTNLHGWVAP